MGCWVVEPPSKNSALIDDSCRIVEVDDDGKFIRVIAKLHRDIDTKSASIMCCVMEMFETIRMVNEDLEGRTYPDDEEETENDVVLDCIEDRITTMLDLIEEHHSQSK